MSTGGSSEPPARSRLFWWGLALLLCLAAGLRLWQLDGPSLDADELSSWLRSSPADLATMLRVWVIPDVHPPGYQLVVWLIEQTLGDSPFLLRLPSVVAGVLAVLAVVLLGRRLYGGSAGLLAGVLACAGLIPLFYSQYNRPYALLWCLSSWSVWCWLPLAAEARGGPRPKLAQLLAWLLCASACCYTHYFGLYLIGLLGLAWLALGWRRLLRLRSLWAQLGVGLAYLPWLPVLWEHLTQRTNHIEPVGADFFPRFLAFALGSSPWLYTVLLAGGLLGWLRARRSTTPALRRADAGLALWLLLPYLGLHLKGLLSTPVLQNRNLLICLTPLFLLLGRGWAGLSRRRPVQAGLGLLLLGLCLVHLLADFQFYSRPHTTEYRSAARAVMAEREAHGDALLVGCGRSPHYIDYYFIQADSPLRTTLMAQRAADAAPLFAALEQAGARHFWLFAVEPPEADLQRLLDARCLLLQERNWLGVQLRLYALRG